MSDHIPFEIQSEVIKMLPVKSIIQFRSVSKQWKAFIDNPLFIKNYHVNHTNPQHHILVSYDLDGTQTFTSIIDNNTFPQHKFPLTAPQSLRSLRNTVTLSSAYGLLCFYVYVDLKTEMAVIWNPTIRKSVTIIIHRASGMRNILAFGVCPDTSDPKLVNIGVLDTIRTPTMWEVTVFMLSTRVWKPVFTGAPFKSCDFTWSQDFVDGVIYFIAYDNIWLLDGGRSNFVISFDDLKSDKFGEVCLPERLVHARDLDVAKVNKSLGLLEYYDEHEMSVCGVWSRKDGADKTFTKIYTVKVEGKSLYSVLGFRNNGEAVMELEADSYGESRIEVYQPLSGHTNGVGINGKIHTFSARSYMETLLLLDEKDAIIY